MTPHIVYGVCNLWLEYRNAKANLPGYSLHKKSFLILTDFLIVGIDALGKWCVCIHVLYTYIIYNK